MNDENIDLELKKGFVSMESYKNLLGAEIYGTATPMQWLIARLAIVQNLIGAGISVTFETGRESGTIGTEKEYFDWCKKHFPSAYRIICEDAHSISSLSYDAEDDQNSVSRKKH